MEYEIVKVEEKTIVGIVARTKNSDKNRSQVIGSLWRDFYQKGIWSSITNKVTSKLLEIYTDYESDEKGEYNAILGYEVNSSDLNSADTVVKTIPGGLYAKFTINGNPQNVVAKFWSEIWEMDLKRSFQCDFEEYQNDDMDNSEIHVYISLSSDITTPRTI